LANAGGDETSRIRLREKKSGVVLDQNERVDVLVILVECLVGIIDENGTGRQYEGVCSARLDHHVEGGGDGGVLDVEDEHLGVGMKEQPVSMLEIKRLGRPLVEVVSERKRTFHHQHLD